MLSAALQDPLGFESCLAFLYYLSGMSTTSLGHMFGVSGRSINRSIQRTARRLLEVAASEYARHLPRTHLSHLRKERAHWVLRLAASAPGEVAAALDCGEIGGDDGMRECCRLLAMFREYRQQLGLPLAGTGAAACLGSARLVALGSHRS